MTVNLEMRGAVAVLTLNHPPVNALSASEKKALAARLETALDDTTVKAVVIAGAGRHFSAGADLREFSNLKTSGPGFSEINARIESAHKPVVAALHGAVAGGALEIAMACHGRVAEDGARFSLPEAGLGMLPGAGGTVRLPRLVGVETALGMILFGRKIEVDEAARLGLVDEAVPRGTVRERAIDHAERAMGQPLRRTRDLVAPVPPPDGWARFEAFVQKTPRESKALRAALECVKRSLTLPFDEAIRREREAFLELVITPEARALRHVFFAERAAQKAGELKKGTTTRAVRNAGVVGFGTMGSGIAMAFANAGIPVVVTDETQEAVDRGLARVRATYEDSRTRGRLTEAECATRVGLVTGAVDWGALSQADLVIEAVFEPATSRA